jgi:hypothetical protein
MLWILPGLGKIGVRILQHRVLVSMPELFLEADIAWDLVILSLRGPLRCVLIVGAIDHDSTSNNNSGENSLVL